MRKTIAMIGAAAAVLTTMAPVSFADAASRHHRHYRHTYTNSRGCQAERHSAATKGAIIGTVGGALIGNALSGGNRTAGTLLGAGAGAYTGHQIGKHNSRCR
ncbi:MAG: hypothetical protein JWP35_2793 [Caulobacter sp.]|nr:hypothetical protein [Caulobacter sp.]